MPPRKKFDVFLSHNSRDKPWVTRLKRSLEALGIKVWLDKDEIRPGDLFGAALEKGIEESKAIALIISPEAMSSGWVQAEYYRALSLATNKRLQLIPVLYKTAQIPGFLSDRNWVDFSGEDKHDEKIRKLAWGITGKKEFRKSTRKPGIQSLARTIQTTGSSPALPPPKPSKPDSVRSKDSNGKSSVRKRKPAHGQPLQKRKSLPRRPVKPRSLIAKLTDDFSVDREYYIDECAAALLKLDTLRTIVGSHWVNPALAYGELVPRIYLLDKIGRIKNLLQEFQTTCPPGVATKRQAIYNELKMLDQELSRKVSNHR